MSAHAVFIEHRAEPGQRARAHEVWDRLLRPAIEANADHLAYTYTFDPADPDVIRAFQLYRSPGAAAAFLESPDYLEYEQAVREFLEGPPSVSVGQAIWTKST